MIDIGLPNNYEVETSQYNTVTIQCIKLLWVTIDIGLPSNYEVEPSQYNTKQFSAMKRGIW